VTIQSDRLPDGKHREILNDILEYKLESATSQKNPRAVIIAGQPGSGKSRITIKAMEEFDRNVIVIDPDKLRSNHPN
jgi:adenylylsulfate kinase-like enzyme